MEVDSSVGSSYGKVGSYVGNSYEKVGSSVVIPSGIVYVKLDSYPLERSYLVHSL